MSTFGWKQVVSQLLEVHNQKGAAVVPVSPNDVAPDSGYVNVTPDDDLLVVERAELRTKEVRKWLWERRKRRSVMRRRAIIWSVFEGGKSYVGVGALTSQDAVLRYGGSDGQTD